MANATLIGFMTFIFVFPAHASTSVPAGDADVDLATQAKAFDFKADYTAQPSLAMLQDAPRNADPFAQGTWIWSLFGGGAFGDEAGEVYLAHLGAGYHVLDNLSFNIEGLLALVDGDEGDVIMGSRSEDAWGGGFNLIIRWHFWHIDKFSMYLDGGCGMLVLDEEFPGHGTNLNFTPQAGVGVTYDLGGNLMLMAGARWYHISNARHSGKDNNPGYDSGLFYAGVMWPF